MCNIPSSVETHSQSAAMPAPTLEFAAICLSNAKFLLPTHPPVISNDPPKPLPAIPAPPGPPIQGHSISSLRSDNLSLSGHQLNNGRTHTHTLSLSISLQMLCFGLPVLCISRPR